MTTGVLLTPNRSAEHVVGDAVEQASLAYDAGVRQVWLGQQLDLDAIAVAAVIGATVPGIGVGTSVVPINPRHPLIVAAPGADRAVGQPRALQSGPRVGRRRARADGVRDTDEPCCATASGVPHCVTRGSRHRNG